MIKYTLTKRPGKTLYESLYKALRSDILNGNLPAGTRLPSRREMAAVNDLSITTVVNAYQQLLMEGYIVSEEKRGYFVADIQAMERLRDIQASAEKKYYTEDQWFADFRANNTLYHYFPFGTWKKVIRQILSEYEIELVARGNPYGIKELRVQIADYLYRVRGIKVSPECIIIGAGIEYLYARLITLFPPGTIYAVENPGYQKISQIYRAYHLRWKSVEMDESGVSMTDLRVKDAVIVHVSPEHHYPLGTLMPMDRRQELLAWASEFEERYIIEDDFDCEFRYNAKPMPALKSLDIHGKVIYMNTFSKTLSPAVRISYMVLPEKLMERYVQETHFFTNSTSSLEQYALARFIEQGYFERRLNKMRKLYRKEGEDLYRALSGNSRIPILSLSNGESGTHLLVRLNTHLSDVQIKQKAAALGIHLSCLSDYCSTYNEKYNNTLVLNFSDMEEAVQKEAIERLGRIFDETSSTCTLVPGYMSKL